jgi:putative addiction module component (TIGR02574 family)
MSALLAELEQKACALSPDERAHFAEVLLESLRASTRPEIEKEWEQEVERRVAAFDRGELQTCTAEDVFADARRESRRVHGYFNGRRERGIRGLTPIDSSSQTKT